MKRLAAVLALLALLTVPASAAAFVPSGLDRAERYLAYKVRVERGQSWYAMTTVLTRSAQQRAWEVADCHARRGWGSWCHEVQAVAERVGCVAGEILAYTTYDDLGVAVRSAIGMWNDSPTHRPILDGRGWRHFGVGVAYARGNHYLVVTVAGC